MTEDVRSPWARLPVELATTMAPQLDRLQAEMLARIAAEPPWSERMGVPSVRADLVAVTAAVVTRFVRLIGTAAPAFGERDRVRFRELGAGEAREGRGLEELLAAYRIGTRVLYTGFAHALADLDASPEAQVALSEAVFALVDTLQGESAEGYANEVSTHSGERERRLRRLADALFSGEDDVVRTVAAQVGWRVPEAVAVALLPIELLADVRAAVGRDGFAVERDSIAVVVLAADQRPGAMLRRLAGDGSAAGDGTATGEASATGGGATIKGGATTGDGTAIKGGAATGGGKVGVRLGPSVPLLDARRSLVVAELLPDDASGLVAAADRLPELLLRGAPEVAATLAERVLEPLATLRASQRERLTATLASWLRHWGQRTEIAAELGVHPQTVGYRVNQLRELLGDALEDPDRRLELQLALLGRGGGAPAQP